MENEEKNIEAKICKNCAYWQPSTLNEFEGNCTADTLMAATLETTDACFTCDHFQRR